MSRRALSWWSSGCRRRTAQARKSRSGRCLPADVAARLERIQTSLLERAIAFQRANTHEVSGWDELVDANAAQGGFLVTGWCGSPACEREVQTTTGATLRVLPFEGQLEGRTPYHLCPLRRPGCGDGGFRARRLTSGRSRDFDGRLQSPRDRRGCR